jgi:hypothetical protein
MEVVGNMKEKHKHNINTKEKNNKIKEEHRHNTIEKKKDQQNNNMNARTI